MDRASAVDTIKRDTLYPLDKRKTRPFSRASPPPQDINHIYCAAIWVAGAASFTS
jgi:hypothetical protein